MLGAANAYNAAEAVAASPIQQVFVAINGPGRALLGGPLIGDGSAGTAAHPDGAAGGIILCNAGNALLIGGRVTVGTPGLGGAKGLLFGQPGANG